MSSDIVLTAALRSNLLSLQNTQRLIDTTQLRLATGLKVNSALDNPQNFFAAQSLNNRANDLQRLLDGIGQSIRTIEEADKGVSSLTKLIEQAESIAQEAQSEIRSAGFARVRGSVDLSTAGKLVNLGGGGLITAGDDFKIVVTDANGVVKTSADINIDATDTVDNIIAEINSDATVGTGAATQLVRASLTSGGQLQIESLVEGAVLRVRDGTTSPGADGFAALGLDTVVGTEDNGAGATRQAGTAIAGNVIQSKVSGATKVNGVYQASDLLGGAAGAGKSGFLTAAGDNINVVLTIDGTTTDLGAVTGADTIQDLIDLVNNAGIDEDVTASFDVDTGRIELQFADNVGRVEIQFNDNGASTPAFGFGTGAADVALGGNDASEQFTLVGTSVDLDQFESDFNTVRSQIDDIVEDAQFRGVNLLNGDNLTTFFNEDRDNFLETEGVDFTALGLGIDEGDFTNAANIQLAIDDSRAALLSVRNFGQSIANDLAIIQVRRDFTEETINTLTAGADDLTVADQNEEGANLLALQTRQALGTTSLSLAAQSQQSVLRLF